MHINTNLGLEFNKLKIQTIHIHHVQTDTDISHICQYLLLFGDD